MNFEEKEAARLLELYNLEILDSTFEQVYDSLVTLLSNCAGCSMAMISFMDKERQWIKSGVGLPVTEVPREHSFCKLTIQESGIVVSEDTNKDLRFRDNPYINGPNAVRFYAGIAFSSVSGNKIGTVCILDKEPKVLTIEMGQALQAVAKQVESLLELRQKDLQLRTIATKQIELEKATIQRHIRQHEEERELIGYELHENYAQTVAACIQYISLCKGADELEAKFLQRTKETLLGLTNSLRQLALDIFPLGSAGIIPENIFEKYIEYFNDLVDFPIFYNCTGNLDVVSPNNLLTLFRIMIEQMHTFESSQIIGMKVYISLFVGDILKMEIRATSHPILQDNYDSSVVANSISKRTQLVAGSSKYTSDGLLGRVLHVSVPL